MKCTLAFALVVCLVRSSVAVSAQQLGEQPIRVSLEREATRLATTLAARDPSWNGSTGFNAPAVQLDRSDDWDTVQRFEEGTRVLVTTRQGRSIDGKLTTVSEDTLQMVVRWGRKQTLLRDDIREVRLGHRLSVGQHASLGLLLGVSAGFLAGSAEACASNVCGGEGGLAVAGGSVYGPLVGSIGGVALRELAPAGPGRLVSARAPSVCSDAHGPTAFLCRPMIVSAAATLSCWLVMIDISASNPSSRRLRKEIAPALAAVP